MRMKKESGKTLREIRRAKKIQKKLMTDEERLIYNLKRVRFHLPISTTLVNYKIHQSNLQSLHS